ncbi:MAG: YaaL family protein [Clostridiales bacterium]|jgi:hypothetical protein|nr:YaaL family protein [Clostridiales bacterium]
MTNVANPQVFVGDIENVVELKTVPAVKGKKKARALSREDEQIVVTVNNLRQEMASLHNRYDQTSEPLLLDSINYELKAVNTKYMYYLQLCKEKGIVSGMLNK